MEIRPVLKVLVFVCDSSEREKLQRTLACHAELTWASNPQEITHQLRRAHYDAVLCARTFLGGTWRRILEEVLLLDPRSPVIILSRTANEEEWVEVLAAGGFDLLGPPYEERELLPALERAVSSHEARFLHDKPGSKRFSPATEGAD